MSPYTYAAKFEVGRRGVIVVSFPDVPDAITEGRDMAEAQAMAEEALGLALLSYPARNLPLPKARVSGKGYVLVTADPDAVAKLAVIEAFAEAGISQTELARRLGKHEKEARRILDPTHATKLPAIAAALRALGKRLVVGVADA